jgi:hypothetical protein
MERPQKGGQMVSPLQTSSAEKAKAFGVRAAFIHTQPNGSQLAGIAALTTKAISNQSLVGSCRSPRCVAHTN